MNKQLPLEKHNSAARHIFCQRLTYTALPVIINSYSLSESSHTIGLNSSSPLDQVICELHGIGWAQGQITWQPDDQNAHQCVLQQRHLGAEAKEEAEEQILKKLSKATVLDTEEIEFEKSHFLSLSGGQLSHL